MRLVLNIEDSRFDDMDLSEQEKLEIIKNEIAENTYPLEDVVTRIVCPDADASPDVVADIGVIPANLARDVA